MTDPEPSAAWSTQQADLNLNTTAQTVREAVSDGFYEAGSRDFRPITTQD